MDCPDSEQNSNCRLRAVAWSAAWAAVLGGVSGLVSIWPDLADAVPRPAFVAIGILLPSVFEIAKLFKMPGTDQ